MAMTPMSDCTTPLEDMKLQNAKDYMALVSSGMTGLGAAKTAIQQRSGSAQALLAARVAAYRRNVQACGRTGGIWDGVSCLPRNKPSNPQAMCQKSGGYWNGSQCTFPQQTPTPVPKYPVPHIPWSDGGYTEPRQGVSGLSDDDVATNPVYGVNAWPPGPQPSPYKWTSPTGTTWSQVLIDGKWMYQSSKNNRYYISASNLYDLMGLAKQAETGLALGPIPGEDRAFSLERWLKNTHKGYLALGALAFFVVIDEVRKKK